jgi:hypothetical protein
MDTLKMENFVWFSELFCEELLTLCVHHDVHKVMDPSLSNLAPADKLKKLQDRIMSIPQVRFLDWTLLHIS